MSHQENVPSGEERREASSHRPGYTGSVMSTEVDKETGEVLTKEEVRRRKEEKSGETIH